MENSGCGGDWMPLHCDGNGISHSNYNSAIPWTTWDGKSSWPQETNAWTPVSGAGSWVSAGNSSPYPMVMQPCSSGVTGHVVVGWAVPVNIVQTAPFTQQAVYSQPTPHQQPNWADRGDQQVPVHSHVHSHVHPESNKDVGPIAERQYESSPRRKRDGRMQGVQPHAVATSSPRRPRISSDSSQSVRASERAELAQKKAALRKERHEDVCVKPRRLEAGSDAWKNLLEAVQGRVLVLAFDASGCRLVQDALDSSPEDIGVLLAEELRGHILRAIDSPHANFVLQKVIDVLPAVRISFVIDEIAGAGVETARHRNGCRVLSRIFEHSGADDTSADAINQGTADAAAGAIKSQTTVSMIMDEVLQEATALSRHPLGHFVIEAILRHGTAIQRAKIAESLRGRLTKNAKNRSASYIVERALQLCGSIERDAMTMELLSNESDLLLLAQCRFGRYVVKTMASLDSVNGQKARSILQAASKELRANKYGSRLFDEMEQTLTI